MEEKRTSWDGEIPDAATGIGPPVQVLLPDGQEVRALLLAKVQVGDGSWWFEVTLPLWSQLISREGRVTHTPADAVFLAPAKVVTPVDGQNYRGTAVRRDPAAVRQRRQAGR
ncbi:hypothetical protein [Streptomyces sp. A5-4]|uniref:hypothetical protein n=1 Tax=Streptomyces sp. A5-4 TaxID=3384771 RepID=UPI003DA8767E